jgi:hypothetical protein
LGGISDDQSSWHWHGTKEDLQAWKDGRTGEKLVDAGMKELLLTGYMSMRARHIVASYLIYELGVDWRHGAAHFEEHLLDYDPALNWVMWMLQTGVMGPKSGRSLGLSHFDAKRPYASQRKQLSYHTPDRAYIQHWLADNRRDGATNSFSHRGHLHKPTPGQHTSAARPIRDDIDEDLKTNAKHQARRKSFSERVPVQLSQVVGKGKGKHRGREHADERFAAGPKKRRWGKNAEGTSYYDSTLAAA